MMKKLILSLLIAAPTAHAGVYFDGNKLMSYLDAAEGSLKKTMAAGYIVGVADARNDVLCVPDAATIRQITDVVHDTLRKFPKLRHEPADMIVEAALAVAFPCKGAL